MQQNGLSEELKEKAVEILNRILEFELAGVVRYTHYAAMVFGHGRIPIVEWLNKQAEENLEHAREAAEMITHLGAHPSLGIGPLLETHKHEIDDILRESLAFELEARDAYLELHDLVEGHSILLEEYAHRHIIEEEEHADMVNKMLRKPGDVQAVT